MTRTLYIDSEHGPYTVDIPDDAKLTFGPWSPQTKGGTAAYSGQIEKGGTLRVYMGARTTGDVIAVLSGVKWYYDQSLIEVKPIGGIPVKTSQPDPNRGIVMYDDLDDVQKEELAESVAKIITGHAVAQKEDTF